MSLKAKLEAVIYAAEEPVTLAQMVPLFAEEALLLKAERADAASEKAARSAQESNEFAEAALAAKGAQLGLPELPAQDSPVDAAVEEGLTETAADDTTEAGAASDIELEAKRLARQRDREVREILRGLLDELIADYASSPRGIEIREIAGGYRMATKPEYHDAVRAFVRSLKSPMKLSLPALETLAVIAYKQPVTSPEVGEIRGVDSAGVLGSLIGRKLITTAGRKQVVGRPILYKTTKEFLLRFGLKDISELPSMEEFEKMAAIELSEDEDSDAESAGAASGELFAGPAQGTQEDVTQVPDAQA
jgi:segregation and condensation protein B